MANTATCKKCNYTGDMSEFYDEKNVIARSHGTATCPKCHSEEVEHPPKCIGCGFIDEPDNFNICASPYHDLRCPKCETTNIDWNCGAYIGNTLQTGKFSK